MPTPPARAMNKNLLARGDVAQLEQCLPGGQSAQRSGRRSISSKAAGLAAKLLIGAAVNSAKVPPCGEYPKTDCPGKKSVTPSPKASTTPEKITT